MGEELALSSPSLPPNQGLNFIPMSPMLVVLVAAANVLDLDQDVMLFLEVPHSQCIVCVRGAVVAVNSL